MIEWVCEVTKLVINITLNVTGIKYAVNMVFTSSWLPEIELSAQNKEDG